MGSNKKGKREMFVRINEGTLINAEEIQEIIKYPEDNNYLIIMKNGKKRKVDDFSPCFESFEMWLKGNSIGFKA